MKYKLAVALAFSSVLGCHQASNGPGSGETHFLRGCSEDAGCASGLECICGVCTVRCDDNNTCKDQGELASCRPSDCSEERICDVECVEDGDCTGLGSEYTCESRRCRPSIEHEKDAGSPDGETIDAGPTPAACLGTEQVEEITRFTLEHTGGIPTPCSDGSYDSDRHEKYVVDLTQAVVTYDLAINCQPAETGTVPLTNDQVAQIRSTLTDLEPQTAQSCWDDYGEGTLSIPGCGEYMNEASDSACDNSALKVLPILEFDALIEIFQKIAFANQTSITCPPGCNLIVGYPVTNCVGLIKDPPTPDVMKIACECGDASTAIPDCHLRTSDGSAWFFMASDLSDPSAWDECTEEQKQASLFACDYDSCERPPLSTCRRSAMCEQRDCDGLQYDEYGCARANCESDNECADEERCVPTECIDISSCYYDSIGECQCVGPDICRRGGFCNPVSTVGARGEWKRIEIIQGGGLCAPGETCIWRWSVTPDGRVDFDKNGSTGYATLSEDELLAVERVVDGPELRVALRDGIQCDGRPTDVGVSIRLLLDSETLERDVTGCAVSGPEGNVFWSLFRLITTY